MSLPVEIKQRLQQIGTDEREITAVLGGNITARLAS
jgi:hypothetical protein